MIKKDIKLKKKTFCKDCLKDPKNCGKNPIECMNTKEAKLIYFKLYESGVTKVLKKRLVVG